tara:strand:+ start:1000 stop:1641 length:642 start_codon:yes stop_codon:yes gene_type:complete
MQLAVTANPEPIQVSDLYGITAPEGKNFVLLRMYYLDEKGKRTRTRTFSYYTDAGYKSAVAFAQQARDELLALPEFQAYLHRHYLPDQAAGVATPSKVRKRADGVSERGIVGLKNIRVASALRVRLDESVITRWDILAMTPDNTSAGSRYRSRTWSIRRYGLHRALWLATAWQAEAEGRARPSDAVIDAAREDILKRHGQQMRSHITGDWELR